MQYSTSDGLLSSPRYRSLHAFAQTAMLCSKKQYQSCWTVAEARIPALSHGHCVRSPNCQYKQHQRANRRASSTIAKAAGFDIQVVLSAILSAVVARSSGPYDSGSLRSRVVNSTASQQCFRRPPTTLSHSHLSILSC